MKTVWHNRVNRQVLAKPSFVVSGGVPYFIIKLEFALSAAGNEFGNLSSMRFSPQSSCFSSLERQKNNTTTITKLDIPLTQTPNIPNQIRWSGLIETLLHVFFCSLLCLRFSFNLTTKDSLKLPPHSVYRPWAAGAVLSLRSSFIAVFSFWWFGGYWICDEVMRASWAQPYFLTKAALSVD